MMIYISYVGRKKIWLHTAYMQLRRDNEIICERICHVQSEPKLRQIKKKKKINIVFR